MTTGLPGMDVASRLDRLRSEFDGAGIDALLVTQLPNVRYLTGFTGSAGMLLVTTADALFVTDGRYRDQAAEQLGAAGVKARVAIGATQTAQRDALSAAASDAGIGRLGLEADGRHLGAAASDGRLVVPGRSSCSPPPIWSRGCGG